MQRHQPLLYHMVDQAGEAAKSSFSERAMQCAIIFISTTCRSYACHREAPHGDACLHLSQSFRLSESASAAFSVFGRGGSIRFLPDKPDLTDLHVDQPALYDTLNYHLPRVDLADGIRRIKMYREAHS